MSPYTNSQIYCLAEYLSNGLLVYAPIRFLACTIDPANVELVSQHSPASSTWGSFFFFGSSLRLLRASRLASTPRPVRFHALQRSRSACLLVRPFLATLMLCYWRLFRDPLDRLAFKWFGSSESNCSTESALSDVFLLLSELTVSNSSSRPLTTSDHV